MTSARESAWRARLLVLLASLVGLGAAILALGAAGFAATFAVVARAGTVGFAIYCAYSLGVSVLLGAAWVSAAPPQPPRRFLSFAWARLVREAASDILPFSQVGGIVIGIRVLIARRIPPPLAYASAIVDLTTEMAGQILLTLVAVAAFAVLDMTTARHGALLIRVCVGCGIVAIIMGIVLATQSRMLALAERVFAGLLPKAAQAVVGVRETLTNIYQNRRRVTGAFAFNLAAWLMSAAGGWVALRAMSVTLPLPSILTIEILIFALRGVAFLVPGGLGVQEAGYLLIGPPLGLDPHAALALSLLKRGRDFAVGVPVLALWQSGEIRHLREARVR